MQCLSGSLLSTFADVECGGRAQSRAPAPNARYSASSLWRILLIPISEWSLSCAQHTGLTSCCAIRSSAILSRILCSCFQEAVEDDRNAN